MPHDHVGIPRFIEKGFSKNGKVSVYNTIENKSYKTSIDRLGTVNNYYESDVEEDLLAKGIEQEFSKLYNNFCTSNYPKEMKSILDNNINLLEQFFFVY